ncbi:hypothetical protein SASPL_151388 [Salvia splendens]|uniref:Phosphatidic acid phosphatase type 2/haloperoxidase domain-containing protein n=1 Tax=Salvia splendens TaxID=180675 RepID=A0A8X8W8K1_SALSN|nr:hypothetical protein SASPL_151388 [Salvia splendens]
MGWKISFCPDTNFRTMLQVRPSQFELECRHTIRSHGRQLARDHRQDWLILLLLVVIEITLNVINPFYRFVGEGMMEDLMYPMKENTVPLWAVPLYAVFLPMTVFFLYYLRRNDVYDLHHSVLGLLFSVLITGVLTDAIKDAVGRPRPDFFYRCFPDGRDITPELIVLITPRRFAGSFAGLGFLALYLSAKIKCFDRSGHVAKLCIVFLPILAACLVAVSRVDDYWHHWQDVFAGGILGLVVATFCYLQFFPPPYQNEGWGPYAYFRAVEDLRSNPLPQDTTNMLGTNQERASTSVVGLQTRARHEPEYQACARFVDDSIYAADNQADSSECVKKPRRLPAFVRLSRTRIDTAPLFSGEFRLSAVKMPEIQLGAHTFRTHGAQVARFHMHDWLILFLLVAIDIILNVIEPFHRFVGQDMMTDLKYPLKDNTIPFWAVPDCFFSVLITAVLTDAIKDAVGRPRPDFYWRCFPDGKPFLHTVAQALVSELNTGCAHIGSFAGLGFLALYLSGKIRVFDRRGHVAKLCLVFFPLLMAALVGVSRVDDYWHHWQDVFAGGLLGWAPHAYLNMVAESQSENRASTNHGSHLTVRESEFETVQV